MYQLKSTCREDILNRHQITEQAAMDSAEGLFDAGPVLTAAMDSDHVSGHLAQRSHRKADFAIFFKASPCNSIRVRMTVGAAQGR